MRFPITTKLGLRFYIRRHKMDYDYWKNTSADFWLREVGYQRHLLHSYGNIPFDTIQVCQPFSITNIVDLTYACNLFGI